MRIVNSTITRQYTAGLNKSYAMLNKYASQVDGTRFTRMSEDVQSGVKVLQLRRNMGRLENNIATVKNAQGIYDAAHANLKQASELSASINERFLQGITDTNAQEDRDAIAQELRQYRDAMMNISNASFSGRKLFGGTNTITNPFTLDDDGVTLLYNGKKVEDLSDSDVNAFQTAYVDIGIGLSLDGQEVDQTTAFAITFNGAEVFGYGDNNLYNIISDMIDMLEGGVPDKDAAGALTDKFQSACSNITTAMAKIDAKYQYLEATLSGMEYDQILYEEKLSTLLHKDTTLAILDMTQQQLIYNAALSLGQSLFQPTLFNFIS